ncbi:MAG: hypothetical protein KIH63_001440 [Candidatus Saccharibacteria bacterium]|nr:hypothetical protein [Candidatus Saccharibacteria bacterium]
MAQPSYDVQVATLLDMQHYISGELFETRASVEVVAAAATHGPWWRRRDLGPVFVDRDYVPEIVPADVFPKLRLVGIEFDSSGRRVEQSFWNIGPIFEGEAVAIAPGVPQRAADIVYDAAVYLQSQQLAGVLPDLSPDLTYIRRTPLLNTDVGL